MARDYMLMHRVIMRLTSLGCIPLSFNGRIAVSETVYGGSNPSKGTILSC